jgi:hypothetical protein
LILITYLLSKIKLDNVLKFAFLTFFLSAIQLNLLISVSIMLITRYSNILSF